MTEVHCKSCGWTGPADDCRAAMSAYHDLACPQCGSSNIDTSNLNKEWAERGEKYGFGDNNSLIMKRG